ncbi:two-component system activity regulator YycH [Marininema halotolerans]|uniref:Two-component signal transduction system YycFG, regulatory protein YycH n=1 Tax=Marininema halotolerans TaxID=1155944 RepID=A0A1I6P937_9BACL|nr:two-component system activity regulator YycH [Marininema halotolerans]SFS36676.1 Two-component signal transduction system YycFG, regulatory protein YycH [Marininema halotolerans]
MKEHIKSVLLTVLMITSLVQSGILLYISPSYEEVLTPDYSYPHKIVKQPFEKKGIHEITAPGQIYIHQDGKHQLLSESLEKGPFRTFLSKLALAEFTRPQKVTPSEKDWESLMKKKQGIELRFSRNLPPDITQSFFSNDFIKPDLSSVSRVWIFENSSGNLAARFISDKTGETIQYKTRLDSFDDCLKIANTFDSPSLSATLPKKNREVPLPFYLPNDPLPMDQMQFPIKKIAINDLKLSLFPDSNLIEKKLTLDHATMYTDTTRTLQHNTAKELMIYNRPDTTTITKGSITDQLDLIYQFMRRHGGWTGNFLLDEVENDSNQSTPYYRFRLYSNGLPVYWDGKEEITPALMRLSAIGKGVTSYDRSLIYPTLQPNKKMTKVDTLLNKKDLLAELDRKGITLEKKVASIHPGYRAAVNKDTVTYIPTWIIQLRDGTRSYVEKRGTGR